MRHLRQHRVQLPSRPVSGADRGQLRWHAPQRETLRSLGLHRIGDSVVKADRPEIRGMIQVVRHLVVVEEVD